MNSITFKEAWRVTHIKRWHMCATTRDQTVAEHMANVQMLCLELMVGWPFHNQLKAEILYYALLHDMDEVVYGDSTPMMKKASEFDTGEHTPEGWGRPVFTTRTMTMAIVDLADKIEALKFIRTYGVGDYSAEAAAACIAAVMDSLEHIRKSLPAALHSHFSVRTRAILNTDRDILL